MPSRRVRLATERSTRSPQRSSVGQRRDRTHVNPAAHDDAAGLDGGERQRDEVADRREDQCGVEGLGRRRGGVAGPRGSQRAREALRRRVARPGEREDAPALVARHLRHQVGRRAESVDADALGITRLSQRAVADQPGAEQRPGLDVGQAGRKRMDEACVGDRVLGVATVQLVAGEARQRAEILVAATAEAALAARPAEPRHADPIALAQRRRRRLPPAPPWRRSRARGRAGASATADRRRRRAGRCGRRRTPGRAAAPRPPRWWGPADRPPARRGPARRAASRACPCIAPDRLRRQSRRGNPGRVSRVRRGSAGSRARSAG